MTLPTFLDEPTLVDNTSPARGWEIGRPNETCRGRSQHGHRFVSFQTCRSIIADRIRGFSPESQLDFIHLRTGEEKRTCKGRYAEGG
jgi:hypothetical protein